MHITICSGYNKHQVRFSPVRLFYEDKSVSVRQAGPNLPENRIIAIRETSIVEYQKQVITELTAKTAMVDRAIENLLVHSDILEPIDVLRLVNAIKTNDNLKRRAAQLPTTYRTSYIDEPDNEEFTYVLGDD